jgi:hypothetical protein
MALREASKHNAPPIRSDGCTPMVKAQRFDVGEGNNEE